MLKRGTATLPMLIKLSFGGGVAFWATTIATSLLPIAAEYRAAYSNWSIQTVWVASLPMGMIIGCCVSYFLPRFFDKLPTKNAIPKSVVLGFIALVVFTILIPVPPGFHEQGDALYYLLIGVLFNAARFLVLGVVIGYLYKRIRRSDESILVLNP